MQEHVIVWDLETVPDLEAVAAVSDLAGKSETEIRDELGDKFPKLIFHRIVCIGALIASRSPIGWQVEAIGAPHIGERSERDLIQGFVDKIGELRPRLVTFNGSSFDLPVLRYRAMINRVSAPGLAARSYFNRYTDDALDLCDALSSFAPRAKVSLHELCRALGFPGKPEGIDGSQVETYYLTGRIKEIAEYCETDIVNTYRVWLRYELFRGGLSPEAYDQCEANLAEWISARANSKQHLTALIKYGAH
jgi:3'-5' exonuclease